MENSLDLKSRVPGPGRNGTGHVIRRHCAEHHWSKAYRIIAMDMTHKTRYGSENFAAIDLSSYLKSLVLYFQGAYSTQAVIWISLKLDKIELNIDQAVPCSLILNELVKNAFNHAFPVWKITGWSESGFIW
jgi:two-component sensor histidine kinase